MYSYTTIKVWNYSTLNYEFYSNGNNLTPRAPLNNLHFDTTLLAGGTPALLNRAI